MPDSTSKRTDELLAESFKALARKKSIEKITVKEITDMAGVIRPTFYSHFKDKYELLEWILKKELTRPCNELLKKGDYKQGIVGFLEGIRGDREFYQSAARTTGQNSFEEILKASFREIILSQVGEEHLRERLWYDWLTPNTIADFFAQPLAYAVFEWIKGDMKVSIDQIWECFVFLMDHSIFEMLLGVRLG